MKRLTHHQKISIGTRLYQQLTPYQQAEARGGLVALARLGRTGTKHECPAYGKTYQYHHGSLTIYVDEAAPLLMVLDDTRVVCHSEQERLVPGPWLDRLLELATAKTITEPVSECRQQAIGPMVEV